MEVVTGPDSIRVEKLNQLVDEYQIDLIRMCYMYLHDAEFAKDATQETFLKAYRALDSFRGACSEKTWLMRIAINTCRDMQRSAWVRHNDRSITPDMLPAATLPFEQEDEELLQSVMNLPTKLREIVLLYFFQNMSVKEIAQSVGITSAGVSNRLNRAKKKLRIALEGRIDYE